MMLRAIAALMMHLLTLYLVVVCKTTKKDLNRTAAGRTPKNATSTPVIKKEGNSNRVETFACEIKQFPTSVNPDSAEFEVLEPASGECFILLSLIKMDNLAVNWKEFLESNGTLDVTCI